MNRFLNLCCTTALLAALSSLHAGNDESSKATATDADAASSTDIHAVDATRLPGSATGSGLISGPQDSKAVCGDPASGSCGGIAPTDAKPTNTTGQETSLEKSSADDKDL